MRLYPGGPPKRPYDVTAQTLPLLMGVKTVTVRDRFSASLEPAKSLQPQLDRSLPSDTWAASDVDSWKTVNQIWKSGRSVWRDSKTGDFLRAAAPGAVEKKKPRVALYRSWISNMDEGWTRWMLEQFGFEYTRLTNPDVLKGGLRDRFDVILFPEARATSMTEGFRSGAMTAEFTGGLGKDGASALKAFAEAGGTLIFLNDASEWAVEHWGLGAKNVLNGLSSRDYYCPGSLLNVRLAEGHPLGLGLPRDLAIWNETSPAWELSTGTSVASYLPKDLLASGWLLGEKYLLNRSAIVDAPMGKGRAILFGMRPQYRAQSYQSLKMLFNAFLL